MIRRSGDVVRGLPPRGLPALDSSGRLTYIPVGMECTLTPSGSAAVRGRPREFDPDAALTAALRVFWTRGYEGASMAELTSAMGITKPSLYACFGNKEALFKKALDLYEREKLAYIGTALAEPTARGVAQRLLSGALNTYCGANDPHGCMGVISMMACVNEAESIKADIMARRASSEAAVIERFEQARKAGDLPDHLCPVSLAKCLLTLLQGMSVKAQAGAERAELQSTIDTFLAMWPGK